MEKCGLAAATVTPVATAASTSYIVVDSASRAGAAPSPCFGFSVHETPI